MCRIMSRDLNSGDYYDELNKHIQINFDCEGYHNKPIEKYHLIEEDMHNILSDKIEIIKIDIPYFLERRYNEDINKLDSLDRFIGLLGVKDKELARNISEGDKNMENIYKKVENIMMIMK